MMEDKMSDNILVENDFEKKIVEVPFSKEDVI